MSVPVHVDAPLRGIAWALLGVSVFPVQDVIVKLLSGSYPVLEIMFVRNVLGLPLTVGLALALEGGLATLRPRRPGLLALRAGLITCTFTVYYLAIATLAIADLAALFFAAPLIMTALAPLVLGEQVGVHRWGAVLVGFVGVLVMLRPGAGVFEPAAVLGLLAALLYACAQLVTRRLGRSESGVSIAFHTTLAFALVSGLGALLASGEPLPGDTHPSVAFLLREWRWPGWRDGLLMAACAPVAAVGVLSMVQAYRLAPAPAVAPFEYVLLLWAVLNGWLFWGDLPGAHTWAGMALVAAAGLYVLRREARLARRRRDVARG